MGRDEVGEVGLDAPNSVFSAKDAAAEGQSRSVAAKDDGEIKVVGPEHVILLQPLLLVGGDLVDRGDGGTDAADGIGMMTNGERGAVLVEADGSDAPQLGQGRTVHHPLAAEVLVGDDGGFRRVGDGDAGPVPAEGGDLPGQSRADVTPRAVGVALHDLDDVGVLGRYGEMGAVPGEGQGRAQRA